MVWRMTKEIIDLGQICVEYNEDTDTWNAINGGTLSYTEMQVLYLFLEQEEEDRRERFETYVNEIINRLIYNR